MLVVTIKTVSTATIGTIASLLVSIATKVMMIKWGLTIVTVVIKLMRLS